MTTETTDQLLLHRGLWLEYLSLSWNVLGVFVMLVTAYRAGSVALAGFGLDSLIEIGASLIVIWNLLGSGVDRERKTLRWIGLAFLVLVLYILVQSGRALYIHAHPNASIAGMAWLGATFLLMLALAVGKQRIGKQLNNAVLLTEGKVTLVDAYLGGSVLLGVALNAFGWWWADPLAGLMLVYYGLKEGREALQKSVRTMIRFRI